MNNCLRTIRLKRKIIREKAGIIPDAQKSEESLFTTDYFDILSTESKPLSDPLTSILGIWPDESIENNDVAVQSYTLYYKEKETKKDTRKDQCLDPFSGDPFTGDSDPALRYLSIIQVHITPETFAHFLETESVPSLIDAVSDDLNHRRTSTIHSRSCKVYH